MFLDGLHVSKDPLCSFCCKIISNHSLYFHKASSYIFSLSLSLPPSLLSPLLAQHLHAPLCFTFVTSSRSAFSSTKVKLFIIPIFRCFFVCCNNSFGECLWFVMTELPRKGSRIDSEEAPEVKYTQIFINNAWVDSGK